MGRATALVKRNVPFKLTVNTASQSCSDIRIIRVSLVIPALLTRISILPNSLTAPFTAASTASELPTSTSKHFTLRPKASIIPTVSANHSAFRSQRATSHPSPANFFAIACPIPRAAPVTNATLPVIVAIPTLLITLREGRIFTPSTPPRPFPVSVHPECSPRTHPYQSA